MGRKDVADELDTGDVMRDGDGNVTAIHLRSLRPDLAGGPMTGSPLEDDLCDQLDELRERIRSGDLSRVERDQLDQLVFVVVVADRQASAAAREYPGEVGVQRALAAKTWARVATQLRVMLGQGVDPGRFGQT